MSSVSLVSPRLGKDCAAFKCNAPKDDAALPHPPFAAQVVVWVAATPTSGRNTI